MKQNSNLALSLHCLGFMAVQPDRLMTLDQIALHNDTNPVVVRRVLGALRDEGLATSDKGRAGGWQLARPAGQITVADIHAAIDEPLLMPRSLATKPGCALVAAMTGIVAAAMSEAKAVLRQHFTCCTVADLPTVLAHKAPSLKAYSPL